MKKILLAAMILMAAVFPAHAQGVVDFDAVKKEGDIMQEVSVDLDGDGAAEKVLLKAYCLDFYETELMSYAGQLVVEKKSGGSYKTIWEGPKIAKDKLYEDRKFGFLFTQGGLETIELIGDVCGDGTVRLLSPQAASDVSPRIFRMYAWKEGRFVFERSGYLCEESDGAKSLKWRDTCNEKFFWVLGFTKLAGPGKAEARVHRYGEKGGGEGGVALLKAAEDGFELAGWAEGPKKW